MTEKIEYFESLADFANAHPETKVAKIFDDLVYIAAQNHDHMTIPVDHLHYSSEKNDYYYVENFLPENVRVRGELDGQFIKFPVQCEDNITALQYNNNIVWFSKGKAKTKQEFLKIISDFCEEIDIEKTIERNIELDYEEDRYD